MTSDEKTRAQIAEIEVRLAWAEKERQNLLHEREKLIASLPTPHAGNVWNQ